MSRSFSFKDAAKPAFGSNDGFGDPANFDLSDPDVDTNDDASGELANEVETGITGRFGLGFGLDLDFLLMAKGSTVPREEEGRTG